MSLRLGRTAGQSLLAHELTHVIQQRDAPRTFPAQLTIGDTDDPAEREADRVAHSFGPSAHLKKSFVSGDLIQTSLSLIRLYNARSRRFPPGRGEFRLDEYDAQVWPE